MKKTYTYYKTGLVLEPEVRERLDEEAAKQGWGSKTRIVNAALRRYLKMPKGAKR